jgi:hypothetical protein
MKDALSGVALFGRLFLIITQPAVDGFGKRPQHRIGLMLTGRIAAMFTVQGLTNGVA